MMRSRTYTLRTGTVPEFASAMLGGFPRAEHSKLGAFWHTDFGAQSGVTSSL